MSTEGDHVEEGREGGKRVEGVRSRCMENVSAEASTSASVRDWTSAGSKVAEEMGGALCDKVKAAVRVIRKAVATYGAEHLALSFNGGKDSTVLLALLAAALHEEGVEGDAHAGTTAFFFEDGDDFEEVCDFTRRAAERYGLHLLVFRGIGFKEGLEILTADFDDADTTTTTTASNCNGNAGSNSTRGGADYSSKSNGSDGSHERNPRPKAPVTAVLMGTRSTDPNARGQRELSPSSPGWPRFMRVNPIIDWQYEDVWRFLLATSTPYCSLYDNGYTSLGNRKNTLRNAELIVRDDNGNETYKPAYELLDGALERRGRTSSYSSAPPPPLPPPEANASHTKHDACR